MGDLDGDSVGDLAVGAATAPDVGSIDHVGQVFVFSGADGSLLRTLNNPNPHLGTLFGERALVGLEDLNGDLVGDIAVGAREQDP